MRTNKKAVPQFEKPIKSKWFLRHLRIKVIEQLLEISKDKARAYLGQAEKLINQNQPISEMLLQVGLKGYLGKIEIEEQKQAALNSELTAARSKSGAITGNIEVKFEIERRLMIYKRNIIF